MKIYSPIDIIEDQLINSTFTINSPNSGFIFSIGYLSGSSQFKTGFCFSGNNGYLFDQSGNFFGGYYSGKQFDLDIYYFENEKRISYFYNKVLIANNIYPKEVLPVLDTIEFDKINESTLQLGKATDALMFYYLQDISGINLISSDNYLLLDNF
jgi:hypothetical protein